METIDTILPRTHNTRYTETPKRVQRLVKKLAREFQALPHNQQQLELAKLRNLRYLVKPEVKKHRSKRHFKSERRERPVEHSFIPEDLQVPEGEMDSDQLVDPRKTTDKFKEKAWLVDGEYQVFRTRFIPDLSYLHTHSELWCCSYCCGW
jgi:hypothetical protein